jgi:3-deoxy-manno-octulosonate cytidylyltransferase (CMP-KDO synthetase)
MKRIIVIPARHGSQRLPGKPLLRSTGKYLIQHVYERACQSRADRVVVATDDPRIRAAVEGFGGEVAMTRRDHPSGTDRVAEVANSADADVIVNLQGDEPMVEPAAIDLLFGLLENEPNTDMATLATPLRSVEQWRNPNCVKVVCDRLGRALYFSRSPVPYVRDGEPDLGKNPGEFLLHLGLYAYRRPVLFRLAAAAPEPLETFEKLEQLRALALGYRIHVGRVESTAGGVDTFEDYQRFVEQYRRSTEPTNTQAA